MDKFELPKCQHNQLHSLCADCQKEWHEKAGKLIGQYYPMFREIALLLEEGSHFSNRITLKHFDKECAVNTDYGALEIKLKE